MATEKAADSEVPSEKLSQHSSAMERSEIIPETKPPKSLPFWAIFAALCITGILAAVESTVTSTALPSIVHALNAEDNYVWFANVYFLTSTCFLPLFGQTSDIFGRRVMMITVISLFMLGSGLSGGAINTTMMIAGRAIQGIGGGGINLMIELVVSDLLPQRERAAYMGIVFAFFALGSSIGPFVGGIIVQRSSWRWVFYMNLPIGGAALILTVLFLNVKYDKDTAVKDKIKRIDYFGNILLIASVVSMLIALSWGGVRYSWSSYQIIVPLIVGFVGLILFHVFEATPWCIEPTVPPRLFAKRTTAIALVLSFLYSMLLYWAIYFLPLFFQSVLASSPTLSGVQSLPTMIVSVPVGIIAGAAVTKTGRYRPMHHLGFAIMMIGFGLYTLLDASTSTAAYVCFQIITAIGLGILLTTLLPAVQVECSEKDVASATATYAFMRAYGGIWGVSVPAAIFNARFASQVHKITDPVVRQIFTAADAYSLGTKESLSILSHESRAQVVDIYAQSLKLAWQIALGFSALCFLLAFIEKEVPLRTILETEFGIEEKEKGQSQDNLEANEKPPNAH